MSSASPRWAFVGQNEMGGAALAALSRRLEAPRLIVTRLPKAEHPNVVLDAAGDRSVTQVGGDALESLVDEFAAVDLVVCCGWDSSVSSRTLEIPSRGWINLHPGSLPQWAGSDPIGWQLAVGAREVECTVHQMTAVVDGGAVLASAMVRVGDAETGLSMRRRAGTVLGNIAAHWILGGTALGKPLRPGAQSTPPRGVRPWIDPSSMSADTVLRVVRAFSPYPGVHLSVAGEVFHVREAKGGDNRMRVACRNRDVEVTRLSRYASEADLP